MSGCSCGSDCKCGSGCRCGMCPDLGFSESTTTETIVAGFAPVQTSEMNFGAENGCKCGSNYTCDPCTCK